MTKKELQELILNETVQEYYISNLAQILDNDDVIAGNFRSIIEEGVFELLDDVAASIVLTMEDKGILVEKDSVFS